MSIFQMHFPYRTVWKCVSHGNPACLCSQDLPVGHCPQPLTLYSFEINFSPFPPAPNQVQNLYPTSWPWGRNAPRWALLTPSYILPRLLTSLETFFLPKEIMTCSNTACCEILLEIQTCGNLRVSAEFFRLVWQDVLCVRCWNLTLRLCPSGVPGKPWRVASTPFSIYFLSLIFCNIVYLYSNLHVVCL